MDDKVIVGNLHQEDRMQEKDANEMAHGMAPVIAGAFRNNIFDIFGFDRSVYFVYGRAAQFIEPNVCNCFLVERPAGIDH